MNSHRGFLLAMCVLLPVGEMLSDTGDRGQAGSFLRRGVGSRALSMGSAYTSVATDASALYWNPAGLPMIARSEFSGMFSLLTLDRQEMFFSFANNFSNTFTLGVGVYRFGVSNIDGRDQYGNQIGSFDDNENCFMLSVGQSFGIVSLGMTGKYLYHSLYNRSGSGLSADVGLIFSPLEMFRIGVVLQDVGAQLKWNTDSQLKENIPVYARIGVSFQPGSIPVVVAVDIAKIARGGTALRTGVEYRPVEFFGVRTGYDGLNATFGGFARIPLQAFDTEVEYAATRDPLEGTYVHHITLDLRF